MEGGKLNGCREFLSMLKDSVQGLQWHGGTLNGAVGESLIQEGVKMKPLANALHCQTTVTSRRHQSLGKAKMGTLERRCPKLQPEVWLVVRWGCCPLLPCSPHCPVGTEFLSIPAPLKFTNIILFEHFGVLKPTFLFTYD